MTRINVIFACLILATAPASVLARTQDRCGWFGQWTPRTYILTDAAGTWILSVRGGGGYRTPGFLDHVPPARDFAGEWRDENGGNGLGYGCACLTGSFDTSTMTALEVLSIRPLPLSRCDADPDLPRW